MRAQSLTALALVAACSGSSGAPAPPPQPSAPPPPPAAPGPPPAPSAPKLVVQALGMTDPFAYPESPWRLVPSHDGALVASFGPELKIVDARTGAVRARSPSCATAAAFAPDDRSLFFLACAGKPVPGPAGSDSPEVAVMRWDLTTDTEAPLASGRFASLALTAGGDGVILAGIRGARVLGLDGGPRAAFQVAGAGGAGGDAEVSISAVAPRGDRALAGIDVLLRDGAPPRKIVGLGPRAEIAPDLRRAAEIRDDGLVVTDVDTGAVILRSPAGKGCQGITWAPAGDRLALSCGERGRATLILDTGGATLCALAGAGFPPGTWLQHLRFSRDGAHVLLELRGGAGVTLRTARVPGCEVERTEVVGEGWFHAGIGDDLGSVHLEAGEDRLEGSLVVLRPGAAPEGGPARTVLPTRVVVPLQPLPDGRLAFEGKRRRYLYDPAAETGRFEPRPLAIGARELVAGGRTLRVAVGGGALASVFTTVKVGVGAVLVLVDGAGKPTPLERSEPYVRRASGEAPQCSASPRGTWVSCVRDGHLAVWEVQTGRRVIDSAGVLPDAATRFSLDFAPDEQHVLLDGGGTLALVHPASTRVLASYPVPNRADRFRAWSPDGKLVADGGAGMIDVETGAVLWRPPPDQPWGKWLPQGNRIAVAREKISSRAFSDTRARLEVRDGRTGAAKGSLGDDIFIVGYAAGGARMLTVDAANVFRVRDTTTLGEIARIGPLLSAALSPDGRFLFAQGNDALRIRRLADGAELFQVVPPGREGERGLSYTPGGAFDGGPEALAAVAYRAGDVRTGKLLRWDEGPAGARKVGLAAAFFAGEAIGAEAR